MKRDRQPLPHGCRHARQAWMLAFDGEAPATRELETHMEACPSCRGFVETSLAARDAVRGLPPGLPDPEADREVVAALSKRNRAGLLPRILAWADVSSWRGVIPLAGVGAASFAVTLLAAGLLSTGTFTEAAHPLQRASPAVLEPLPRSVAEAELPLEAWLERGTPTSLLPRPVPAPPPAGEPRRDPARRSARPVSRTSA